MLLFNQSKKPNDCITLTNDKIFKGLVKLLADVKMQFPIEYLYFNLLYNTGCRPTEPLKFEMWEVTGNDEISLETLKTGEIRKFTENEVGSIFYNAIDQGINIFDRYNYKHLIRNYKRFCPIAQAWLADKQIEMNMFRHWKVKMMFEQGITKHDITEYFAWKDPQMINNYLNSEICL